MTEWLKRDLLDALLAQRTLAKHVRAWWVIDIRRGLSGPLHIGQNGLSKMPTPEVRGDRRAGLGARGKQNQGVFRQSQMKMQTA